MGASSKKRLHDRKVKPVRRDDFKVNPTDELDLNQLKTQGKLVLERNKGLFKIRTTVTILPPKKGKFEPKKLKKFEVEAKIEKVPLLEKEVKGSVEPVHGTGGTGETDVDPRAERLNELRRTIEDENVLEWAGGYLVKTDFPYVPATVDPANLRLFYVSANYKVYELREARYEYVYDKDFLLDGNLDKKEILRTVKNQRVLHEIARIIGTRDAALALALLPPLFAPNSAKNDVIF